MFFFGINPDITKWNFDNNINNINKENVFIECKEKYFEKIKIYKRINLNII